VQGISDDEAAAYDAPFPGRRYRAGVRRFPALVPPVMKALAETIRGCPAPLELPEAGHFVQEHGREPAATHLECTAQVHANRKHSRQETNTYSHSSGRESA
jgi:hypothetical protein